MSDTSNYELIKAAEEKLHDVQTRWHDPVLVDCIREILEVLKRIA